MPVSTWYGIVVTNSRVDSINLQNNNLIGSIPRTIGYLTDTRSINFAVNTLSDVIPVSIGNCKNLGTLFLGYNNLSGNIPGSLGDCSALTILNLSKNFLQGAVPPDLGNCRMLTNFLLNNDLLPGSVPKKFLRLGRCYISLSYNELDNIEKEPEEQVDAIADVNYNRFTFSVLETAV